MSTYNLQLILSRRPVNGNKARSFPTSQPASYLIRLADTFNIDLVNTAHYKIALSDRKYPADKVKGDARKYTEYGERETNRDKTSGDTRRTVD